MADEDQLDQRAAVRPEPEGDVNIQCIQSSEFVIGKQTNFNGPVTIINCPNDAEVPQERKQEKIIIRDKVLSPLTKDKLDGQTDSKRDLVLKKLTKLGWVPVVVFVGLLIVVVVVCFGVFLTTAPSESDGDTNSTYRFYTKADWGGKPPKSTIAMKLPVPYVVISHTVTPRCHNLKLCAPLIQNMQSYHLSLDFADIAYNFLLDSSGNIYEGRGWSRRNANGGFVNGRSVDLALIGDYSDTEHPTQRMLDGLAYLLKFGIEKGKISESYSLIAANATFVTLSPGKNVYRVIERWPHFDANPKAHVKDFEDTQLPLPG